MTDHDSPASARIPRRYSRNHNANLALCIAALLLIIPALLFSVTFAQGTPDIVVAHGVPGPIIKKDEQGRDQIDILGVNSQGISHNQYEEFHVNEHGVMLNNHVAQANLILNEVVGAHISQLNGPIEVKGKTADVIVANPNGIDCNGCGFINSMRGILTTGKFVLEQGALTGIEVNSGHITIGERGAIMYAAPGINHGSIDLIAAGVTVNGNIRGEIFSGQKNIQENKVSEQKQAAIQSIRILAGRYTVSNKFNNHHHTQIIDRVYDTNEKTENEKIDVGMLGGMYARQIYLYGNKAGIGVNSHAIIQGVRNLAINTRGELTLNASLTADNIDVQNASVFTNNNRLTAEKNLCIRGVEKFFNGRESDLSSHENTHIAVIKARDINITSQSIHNYGILVADNKILMNVGHDQNTISGEQENSLLTGAHFINLEENFLKNHGSILSKGNIVIRAPSLHNDIYHKVESKFIPVIHAGQQLTINTSHGRNSGGILSADKSLKIYSMNDTISSGIFNNQALISYQDEYTKFNGIDTLVNKKTVKNLGGIIFANEHIDIILNSMSNHGAMHDMLSDNISDKAGEIYSGNKINIHVNEFMNKGGKITAETVDIVALENFSNISASIYGVNNKIQAKNFTHTTKVTDFFGKKDYMDFSSPKGLIESENMTTLNVTGVLTIEGADIVSGGDMNINGGEQTTIIPSIMEEKITQELNENYIEDSFFKIYSVNNKKKTQSLRQKFIMPILKSNNNITLINKGSIELRGTKMYADNDITIKSAQEDIEFNPFYLITATQEDNRLSRNMKILGGIKTWEENKFSVNSNFIINHLTTEVFFGKKLSIHSPDGTIYLGKVDFALMENEQKPSRGVIDITGGKIKSTKEQTIERSEIKSHDTFLGFRIEGHSSVIDAINNVSKNIDVKGGEKAYVKASIMKGAQVLGEATNVALGDTLGGSAGWVKETTDTKSNQDNFNDGINLFYADDIFFTATQGNIELDGADLLSRSADSHIKLKAKNSIHLRQANDSSYWKFNRENQEFTLGTVANSNLMLGSAGGGVRAGYNNSHQQDMVTDSRFVPFNISAKNVSFHSVQDVFLHGGKITAGLVDYHIAGTLKIETTQDTSTSETKEGSYGGSLGLDINTYTLFGLNGDVHGSSGHSQDRAALSTYQSGVFARSIRGIIGGDFWLTGAYLIGQTPEDELNVYGKVYAKSLEDTENKEGFVIGGGINISADGRPGGNINYSSPTLINYKASQLPTLTGVTLKTNYEITGSFNTNKTELMKITQNDTVGDIEIKGTFAFINKKNKEDKKVQEPQKVQQSKKAIHYELTPHQIYTYATSVPEGEHISDNGTPFKNNGKSYIRIDDHHFEVTWDGVNHTWRIISPLHGALKPQIPVVWDDGKWAIHSHVGLPGGGNASDNHSASQNHLVSRLAALFNRKSSAKKEEALEMSVMDPSRINTRADTGVDNRQETDAVMNISTARQKNYVSTSSAITEVDQETFKLLTIAENLNRKVRNEFPLGAGNQKQDVLNSGGLSLFRVAVLQEIQAIHLQKQPQFSQEYIRLMQSSGAGNCGEHAEMAYHYATSLYGDQLDVKRVNSSDNSHSFVVIQNRGNTNPKNRVVIDTWAIDGGVHLVEDNTLEVGRVIKENNTNQKQMARFNKNTESYQNIAKFFERWLKDNYHQDPEKLQDIVDKVSQARPTPSNSDHDMWDLRLSIKDKNRVYQLQNSQEVFIPVLPDTDRNAKMKIKVDSLINPTIHQIN